MADHKDSLTLPVQPRVEGRSFARISEGLKVSKRTLIKRGRKFQFETHNARVIESEALHERFLASREERRGAT